MENDEAVVSQQTPLIIGQYDVPVFNIDALVTAIKKDQSGNSTFQEFLQSAWNAGVISYDVDFINRKVIYYGINKNKYVEEYPSVVVEHSNFLLI